MSKKRNTDLDKIRIGKIMKTIRKSRGLTQEQVAEKLGLASRYISDIERDKTKGSLNTLVSLCNIYHITPTYVLKEYLNTSDYKEDIQLVGFYRLSKKEKQLVLKLIEFMNSTKSNQKNTNIDQEQFPE